MNKLEELTLEELITLNDECIEAHEYKISDECFRRYGVKLIENDQSWWRKNSYKVGLASGLALSIIARFIVNFISHYI